jgi:hypothetical protein
MAGDTIDYQAWAAYLSTRRDAAVLAWERAAGAYKVMRKVQQDLGLPAITTITEQGGTGWTAALEQDALDLQTMVQFATKVADEALLGHRKVMWSDPDGSLVIESQKSDEYRIAADTTGKLILVDNLTGQPTHITTGTIGAFPIVVGIVGVIALAVVTLLEIERVCDAMRAVAEQVTYRTLSNNERALVASGQATPAQAASMTKSILDAAVAVEQQKTAQKTAPTNNLLSTSEKILLAGLGISALVAVINITRLLKAQSAPAAKAA